MWPDAILVGRLQALLAELEMDPRKFSGQSDPLPQDCTAMIFAAIEQSRTLLLVHIDHPVEECNLIWNDFDKIRGRLTETETRVSATEDLMGVHCSRIITTLKVSCLHSQTGCWLCLQQR